MTVKSVIVLLAGGLVARGPRRDLAVNRDVANESLAELAVDDGRCLRRESDGLTSSARLPLTRSRRRTFFQFDTSPRQLAEPQPAGTRPRARCRMALNASREWRRYRVTVKPLARMPPVPTRTSQTGSLASPLL